MYPSGSPRPQRRTGRAPWRGGPALGKPTPTSSACSTASGRHQYPRRARTRHDIELDLGLRLHGTSRLLTSLEHALNIEVPGGNGPDDLHARDLADVPPRGGRHAPGAAAAHIDPWGAPALDDPTMRIWASCCVAEADRGLRPAFVVMKAVFLAPACSCACACRAARWCPARARSWSARTTRASWTCSPPSALRFSHVAAHVLPVGASEYFEGPLKQWFAPPRERLPGGPRHGTSCAPCGPARRFAAREGPHLSSPEGERSPDGAVRKFKKGAAILSISSACDRAVAIHGVFELWPRGKPFQWGALLPWAGTRPALSFGFLTPQSVPAPPGPIAMR